MLHAEALERLYVEVAQQLLVGGLLGEHPVVKLKGEKLVAEPALKLSPAAALKEHFLRRKVYEQLLNIVVRAFAGEKFACRNVEKRHSARRLAEVDGCQEVVFLIVEHIVGHGHSGRNQLGYASLNELLGELRVLQLVAYSHSPARPYELRQICVERMMRKSGHLGRVFRASVVALGERYAKNLAGVYGVLKVCLIKVAATKQQQRVGMFSLQRHKLFHHRC